MYVKSYAAHYIAYAMDKAGRNSFELCCCRDLVLLASGRPRRDFKARLRVARASAAKLLGWVSAQSTRGEVRGRGQRADRLLRAIGTGSMRIELARVLDGDLQSCCGWVDHVREIVGTRRFTPAQLQTHLRSHLDNLRDFDSKERERVLRRIMDAAKKIHPSLSQLDEEYRVERDEWGRRALAAVSGVQETYLKRILREDRGRTEHFVSTDLGELKKLEDDSERLTKTQQPAREEE